MKILIGMICDGKAGGVDKYILNFYESVRSDEVKIDFLTNNIDEELKNRLEQNGSKLWCVSSLKNPGLQYRQAKEIIAEKEYDVVYMNISMALAYPVLKAAHDCGVRKVIAHSHNSGVDIANALKRFIMTALHKACKGRVCRYATDFLTCSDKAAEWMFTDTVLKSGKVKRIQNTVDLSLFHFNSEQRKTIRDELGIAGKFVVGTVGNMLYQKNHLFLLDVFKEIAERESESILVIVGEGSLRGEIEAKIDAFRLKDSVLLLGRVDVSKGYMSAFDVFALPSNFEGMPIVSVEAQMSKLPCVISDTVTREAKISNMCDFVSIKDAAAWADAILKYKGISREEFLLSGDEKEFSLKNQQKVLNQIIE